MRNFQLGENSIVTIHIDTEVDIVIFQKPLDQGPSSIRTLMKKIVLNIENVKSCDNISFKKFNDELHASISCTLKRDLKVKDAHEVAEKIEAAVTSKITKVSKVFVHTEPPQDIDKIK
jgi:divalent metal cation (Fe/Co/Zn/Cd) transporter